MIINKQYISTKNTNSARNNPKYIITHETDNYSVGANAERHAYAQYNGHFSNMSVHFYCGDDGVYQGADYYSSCWSIGKNYSNTHDITDATNYNVISIEICVNEDGNYDIARANAIELTKFLMSDLGISADRVIRHYDAKGKYCPRKMMDEPSLWIDFKNQIGSNVNPTPIEPQPLDKYYRVGTSWSNGICIGQIGAYTSLDNAKNACIVGYNVYDDNGNIVFSNQPTPIPPKPIPTPPKPKPTELHNANVLSWQKAMNFGFDTHELKEDGYFGDNSKAFANSHQLHEGIKGCPTAVRWLQNRLTVLGFYRGNIDGKIEDGTNKSIKAFQNARGLKADGYVGTSTTYELLK